MAVPRFLFVSGIKAQLAAPDGAPAEDGAPLSRLTGVSWRLLGGNNRELGRSAQVFAALEECELAALDIQRRVATATPELRAEPGTGRWTWQLRLDGEPVAVAGRAYLRLRECHYNLAQFVAFAPAAGVAHTTVTRRTGGAGTPAVSA